MIQIGIPATFLKSQNIKNINVFVSEICFDIFLN